MTALRLLIALTLGLGIASSVFQYLQETEEEEERRRKALTHMDSPW